jgi:DNA-directed RNA polymerase specialized sigma24 family protein
MAAIREVLGSISEKEREILYTILLQGHTVEKTAAVFEVDAAKVKGILAEAKKQFRKTLHGGK